MERLNQQYAANKVTNEYLDTLAVAAFTPHVADDVEPKNTRRQLFQTNNKLG